MADLCGDYRLTDYERNKPKLDDESLVWACGSTAPYTAAEDIVIPIVTGDDPNEFTDIDIVPDDSDTDSEL